MKHRIFFGAATALVTPMREDGETDLAMLRQICEWQVESGIDALVPCGTTGESATMTAKERNIVIETVVDTVNGRIPVIAGAGCNDTRKAEQNCRDAKAAGADALLLVTPYYNKCTQNGLVEHYLRLADATDLPVILYNVPSRTGVSVGLEARTALCKHPNIAAIKEADTNLSLVSDTIDACKDNLTVYSGNDDLTLPMMSLGAAGVISVLSNLIPGEVASLCTAIQKNDMPKAQRLHYSFLPMIHALFSEVNPIPVKAAMRLAGFPCGECRMPLGRIEPQHAEELRRAWQSLKSVQIV